MGAERRADRSFAEKIRNFILGFGQIAIELAGITSGGGTDHQHGATHDSTYGDSPRARTWYGRILQWAWALLVLLVGLVCLALALVLAALWVMSWFR